ncbi:MAG: pyruvate formate-lyase-activating protein [Anaerovoracaceae bacterium]|jgi:pyruvate formate lyase activating enzyme
MIGRISSFQSLGAVDGPGLRCVVFMQGCPLRCAYCHNPESWNPEGGEEISIDQLVSKIQRFRSYISKDGGVTISGGEPLFQHEFVLELMKRLKEKGYHTALDTSGVGDLENSEKILRYTDLVIADLKFTDAEKFKKYCRGDLQQVYDFLTLTAKMGIPLWIRQVIVPGINDKEEDISDLNHILSRYSNLKKVTLLPFRKLCLSKYEELNIPFQLKETPECSTEQLKMLQKMIEI